ncbi:MAG: DUF1566 domain-containing protein [Spirochaetes bacterium]|nr:DUF1566 domain-containing protein [Spirochaetota bacterium]
MRLKCLILLVSFLMFQPSSSQQKRFIDNKDDSITDAKTGLIWLKNADFAQKRLYPQDVAAVYSKLRSVSKSQNWRVPTSAEFNALLEDIDPKNRIKILGNAGFQNVRDLYIFANGEAWNISNNRSHKSEGIGQNLYYLWPVRDNEMNPSDITADKTKNLPDLGNRFKSENNDIITDTKTGLSWLKDTSYGGEKTWDEAVNYAKNFSKYGHKDWRLPTRKDFQMLFQGMDNSNDWTEFLKKAGFVKISKWYWTSTPSLDWPSTACYYANVNYGFINVNAKKNLNSVWLVRGK